MLGLLLSWSKPDLPAISTFATSVDAIYAFIFWVSVVCFIAIVGTMVYFVVKYRRKSENDKTPYIEGHTPTEVGISVGLFVLVMGLFYWGWVEYMNSRTAPMNAYEINVTGQQWSWNYQYANGKRVQRDLYIPSNTPIKLIMGSTDVLHSFFVPALRLKQDVVPGTYQLLSFTATTPGQYDIFCAEFCGLDHAAMLGKLVVLPPDEFDDWVDGLGNYAKGNAQAATKSGIGKSLVEIGRQLYTSKTCSACHSDDGSARVGPSFKGLFGKQETLNDGSTITVTEQFIRDAINEPNKQVAKGYVPGTMPTFKGQIGNDEMNALVAYIKSLK